MNRNAEPESVRPITDLMRVRDEELERMISRDQRWLAAIVLGLCVAGVVLWIA